MSALRNRLLKLVGNDHLVDTVLRELRDLKREDVKPAMQVAERADLDVVEDEYLAMHRAVFDAAAQGS